MDSKAGVKSHLNAFRKRWKAVNGKERVRLVGKLLLRPFGVKKCLFLGGYYVEEMYRQEQADQEIYFKLQQGQVSEFHKPKVKPKADAVSKVAPDLDKTVKVLQERKDYVALAVESLDNGGLEEVVHMLACGLQKCNIPVRVFCMQSGGCIAKNLKDQGIEVVVFDGNQKNMRKYCLEEPPMLVNTHYVGAAMKVFYELNIPIVEVIHNTYAFLDEAGWERERNKSQYIQKYIAVSECAKRMFCSKCETVEKDKVTVIGNGTRCDWEYEGLHEKTRRALGISPEAFVCIAVGSIDARKNQIGLLRAWSIFRKLIDEEAVLLIAGSSLDDEYEAHVVELLKHRELENSVVMLGQSDCVPELLSASDLFLMDSYYEGWSVAATEALCHGIPVIHSDCGSGRELTSEGCLGILCPNPLKQLEKCNSIELYELMHAGRNDNIEELVSAMWQMYRDREYWKTKRNTIKNLAKERFSFENMFSNYLYEFEKLMKEREAFLMTDTDEKDRSRLYE